MYSFSTSFYGGLSWDLGNPITVQDVCVSCRKGLRRVWGLTHPMHYELHSVLCNTIPISDTNFINNCLSDSAKLFKCYWSHGRNTFFIVAVTAMTFAGYFAI